MIHTVTLNPALDKTVEIPSLTVDAVNRITAMRTDPGGKGINVSKVISVLGGSSVAYGILGGDTGRAILAALDEMGLATCFHFVDGAAPAAWVSRRLCCLVSEKAPRTGP